MSGIGGLPGYGPWISYTSSVVATGGTWANAATINAARYQLFGKTCRVYGDFTMGASVTGGTTGIDFGLPFAARSGFYVQRGLVNSNGKVMGGQVGFTSQSICTFRLYDGTNPAVNLERYFAGLEYEVA